MMDKRKLGGVVDNASAKHCSTVPKASRIPIVPTIPTVTFSTYSTYSQYL